MEKSFSPSLQNMVDFNSLPIVNSRIEGEKRKLPEDGWVKVPSTRGNKFNIGKNEIFFRDNNGEGKALGFTDSNGDLVTDHKIDMGLSVSIKDDGSFVLKNETDADREIWTSTGEKQVIKARSGITTVKGLFRVYTGAENNFATVKIDGGDLLVKQTRFEDKIKDYSKEKDYKGGLKMANVLDGLPYNPFSEFKRKTGASISNVEIIIGGSPDLEQKPNEFTIAFADNKGVPLREKYSPRELKLAMKGGGLQITNLSNDHFATFNEDSPAGRVYDGKVDPQGTIELQDNQIIKLKIRDIDYIVKTGSLEKNPPEVYITSTTSKK